MDEPAWPDYAYARTHALARAWGVHPAEHPPSPIISTNQWSTNGQSISYTRATNFIVFCGGTEYLFLYLVW